MKRITLILALCLIGFASASAQTPVKADTTKQGVAQATAVPSLATIVEKMEKEGANWNEEQWKENMKLALLSMKPIMVKMEELVKKMETDTEAAIAELQEISESGEFEQFEELTNKMEKIMEANPIAKKLNEDDSWLEEFVKENGIPDL
jgi:hypothetical protein